MQKGYGDIKGLGPGDNRSIGSLSCLTNVRQKQGADSYPPLLHVFHQLRYTGAMIQILMGEKDCIQSADPLML